MIEIHKDCSNKTYEFILYYDSEEILQGDGWESKEEIKEFLNRVYKSL